MGRLGPDGRCWFCAELHDGGFAPDCWDPRAAEASGYCDCPPCLEVHERACYCDVCLYYIAGEGAS